MTVERQCEKEWVREMEALVRDSDIVLSVACGVGVQVVQAMYPTVRVVPGLNTSNMGAPEEPGVYRGEVRWMRGLRPPPDRRHMPHRPMLQVAAERPLRGLSERQVRGELGDALRLGGDLPQPGSDWDDWTCWRRTSLPRTGCPPAPAVRAGSCAARRCSGDEEKHMEGGR